MDGIRAQRLIVERLLFETVGALARDFKRRSLMGKAYVAAQLAGPLGVIFVAVGSMGHDHALLVVGIVLLVVFCVDMAAFPLLRARHELRRQRKR